ncbi:MAG: aspartyl protease family protein [Bacteroidota bacterium]
MERTLNSYPREAEVKPECNELVVTIPLKRAGRLLIIEAEVDSVRGNFIFDTGAPYLVLNKTYFRDYKKHRRGTASGIAGSEAVRSVEIDHLQFRGINYHDLDADLANLGAIENMRGIKILGLLGFNLFKEFEMEIDVRNGVLKLYKTDEEGKTLESAPKAVCEIKQAIRIYDNTIFTDCYIADKKLRFGFDTGAETNALSSRVNKKILETISITGRRTLNGVGDESVEILFGRMNNFQLGENSLLGMQTLITNMDDMSAAYGTTVDGMLGFDFLAKGVVRINCKQNFMKLCLFDKFSNE